MKKGFYLRLAWNNIKSNYRFFVPRMIAEAGLLACFYIAVTLAADGRLSEIKGGSYIPTIMGMGTGVLALLSAVIMLYTNSFLMKQRKREYGIYNVLGLEKRHIGRIMFHETFIGSVISVICGLALGILFYKLCSLFICRLLKSEILIGFYYINPLPLAVSGGSFLALDLLTYLYNRISVRRMKPVELLQSRSAGEREPKVILPLLIAGVAALGTGYGISLSVKSPLQAISLFFVAVILVIIGTYFLFITGTTFVLKGLKKKESYYYDKKHMPAVSGLLYRMKQNAVGLASVAVLATGLLVMISTTVSLYAGYKDVLKTTYPQDLYAEGGYISDDEYVSIPSEDMKAIVEKAARDCGVGIEKTEKHRYLSVSYSVKDNVCLGNTDTVADIGSVANFVFITESTYRELTGRETGLSDGEIAVTRLTAKDGALSGLTGRLTIEGTEYRIASTPEIFPIYPQTMISPFSTYGVVVADGEELGRIYEGQKQTYGIHASEYSERIAATFEDLSEAKKNGNAIVGSIYSGIYDYRDSVGATEAEGTVDSVWQAEEAMTGLYGSLLFLGILLGAVCLFATALIIYYKQISEGYEDRERFVIMEKVGMSRKEVKKTINSQVLLVFFMPLIVAGVHLTVAFPILTRLLKILMLTNTGLFAVCTLITFAAFAAVYALIYAGTSKTYYKIVH